MNLPKFVKIVEVGPRDGLQNEKTNVPTNIKIDLINKLSETGLSTIEATSFVSPKWIPQLQDANSVYKGITKNNNIRYPVITPNQQGLENAIKSSPNIKDIAVITATSNTFTKKNINCTIDESLEKIKIITDQAKKKNIAVRGYISCVLGCPYEGKIDKKIVNEITSELFRLGCYEVSLGDTIGIGTPNKAVELIEYIINDNDLNKLAVHFHDTFGQALANIYAVLQLGVRVVDSSIAGLGGCPYARGASGNVATEDVLYMLHGMNIETGISMDKILDASHFVSKILGHPARSKVALASMSSS